MLTVFSKHYLAHPEKHLPQLLCDETSAVSRQGAPKGEKLLMLALTTQPGPSWQNQHFNKCLWNRSQYRTQHVNERLLISQCRSVKAKYDMALLRRAQPDFQCSVVHFIVCQISSVQALPFLLGLSASFYCDFKHTHTQCSPG